MTDAATAPRPWVYLVEDDDAVRRALTFALELEGFDVSGFGSGEDILQRAADIGAGCLVIDERLPGIGGLETLGGLRARQVDCPALLITSHPKPSFRQAAAAANAPILEKPLITESLVAAIRTALR